MLHNAALSLIELAGGLNMFVDVTKSHYLDKITECYLHFIGKVWFRKATRMRWFIFQNWRFIQITCTSQQGFRSRRAKGIWCISRLAVENVSAGTHSFYLGGHLEIDCWVAFSLPLTGRLPFPSSFHSSAGSPWLWNSITSDGCWWRHMQWWLWIITEYRGRTETDRRKTENGEKWLRAQNGWWPNWIRLILWRWSCCATERWNQEVKLCCSRGYY